MEYFDLDDIRRSLQSDKVADRKKGRLACEELLKSDKKYVVGTSKVWSGLISAAIEYELKETDAAQRKDKAIDGNIVIFLKKVVRHCITNDLLIASKLKELITHSLNVLKDAFYPLFYKEEHRQILIDVLDVKIPHHIPSDYVRKVITYVDNLLVDKKSVLDTFNHRLLKALYKSLLKDISEGNTLTAMVSSLLTILNKAIEVIRGDIDAQDEFIGIFAECYTCIIDHYGINLSPTSMIDSAAKLFPFQIMVRHLSSNSSNIRDSSRDSCLKFLLAFFNLLITCNWRMKDVSSSIASPFLSFLNNLCTSLTSDECLSSLIAYANSTIVKQGRVSDVLFFNLLQDSRIRLNFEIISKACMFYHLYTSYTASVLVELEDDAASSKRGRRGEDAHVIMDSVPATATLSFNFVDDIVERIKSSVILNSKLKHSALVATSSISSNPSLSSLNSNERSSQAIVVSSTSTTARYILESLLLVLITLSKNSPDGMYLADASGTVVTVVIKLRSLISSLKVKFEQCCAANLDSQLLGYLLLALEEMAKISGRLISLLEQSQLRYDDDPQNDVTHTHIDTNNLRYEWTELVRSMSCNQYVRNISEGLRRNTLLERVFSLYNTILAANLLDPVNKWNILQHMWSHPVHSNPLLVDSAQYFILFATMISISQNDIPPSIAQGYCKPTVAVASSDDMTASDVYMYNMPNCDGSVIGSVYIAYWFDSLLSAGSSSSMSTSFLIENCGSIANTLQAILIPNDYSARNNSLYSNFYEKSVDYYKQSRVEKDVIGSSSAAPTALNSAHAAVFYLWNSLHQKLVSRDSVDDAVIQHNDSLWSDLRIPKASSETQVKVSSTHTKCGNAVEQSLEVFHQLKDKLLSVTTNEKKVAASVDHFTAWQIVVLMLMEAYLVHLECLINDYDRTDSRVAISDWTSVILSATDSFWYLCNCCLDVLLARLFTLKWVYISEYTDCFGYTVKRMVELENRYNFQELLHRPNADRRDAINSKLLKLLRHIRDKSLHKGDGMSVDNGVISDLSSQSEDRRNNKNSASMLSFNSPKRAKLEKQMTTLDNDDFMQDVVTSNRGLYITQKGDEVRYTKGGVLRILFTRDQESSFASVAQCIVVLASDNIYLNEIFELLGQKSATTSDKLSVSRSKPFLPMHVTTDTLLYIGECISSTMTLCSDHQVNVAHSLLALPCYDNIETGLLGYHRLFNVCYSYSCDVSFVSGSVPEALESFLFLLFSVENFAKKYEGMFWRIKILQLKCLANLFRVHEVAVERKKEISGIFSVASIDPDVRIRLLASNYMPLLFKVFSKPLNVFNGLIANINVPINFNTLLPHSNSNSNECDLPVTAGKSDFAVTLALTIVRMGVNKYSGDSLVEVALYDALVLCATRDKANSDQYSPDFHILLIDLLDYMSSNLGYANSQSLLLDYLPRLLHKWINPTYSTDSNLESSQLSELPLPLELFPYRVLLGASYHEKGDDSQAYKAFLLRYSPYIIPVIFQIEDRARRLSILEKVAESVHGTLSDQHIAQVTIDAICSVSAIIRIFIGVLVEVEAAALASRDDAVLLRGTIDTMITSSSKYASESITAEKLQYFISDSVMEIFNSLTYIFQLYPACFRFRLVEGKDSSSVYHAHVRSILAHALKVSTEYYDMRSVTELLGKCNIIEILSLLRNRVVETRQSVVIISILAGIRVIIQHLGTETYLSTLRALLATIVAISKQTSRLCDLLCDTMKDLGNYIQQLCATKAGFAITSTFLPEFFAELICLHEAIHRQAGSAHTAGPNDAVVLSYFVVSDAYVVPISDDKRRIKQAIHILETLFDIVIHIVLHIGFDSIECLLPLPERFLALLPKKCEEFISSYTSGKGFLSIVNYFVAYSERFIMGEPISLSALWIMICCISDQLEYHGIHSHESVTPLQCNYFWKNETDLMAKLTSSLVGLCSSSSYMRKILQSKAMAILGMIGPPDLLCVHHHLLPNQPGSVLKSSNVNQLKYSLILKIYGMIWDTSSSALICKQAAIVMRSLQVKGQVSQIIDANKKLETGSKAEMAHDGLHQYAGVPLLPCVETGNSRKVAGKGFSPETWNITNKTFDAWVTAVVPEVINQCYQGIESAETSSLSATRKRSAPSHSSNLVQGTDKFISSVQLLSHLRPDVAESIFPLLVYDILSNPASMAIATDSISSRFKDILVSATATKSADKKIIQLICRTLVFILRQKICEFAVKPVMRKVSKDAKSDKKSDAAEYRLPYSYVLDIDLELAATAAVSCGCTCAALLFAELADENRKHRIKYSSINGFSEHDVTAVSADLLMCIFKDIHDPDAIYGVNPRTDLQLQAIMYSHTGSWMEALLTYESLVNIPPSTQSTKVISPKLGIAQSLQGLGAQHTLSYYALQSIDESSVQSLASESSWWLGNKHASYNADAALRQWGSTNIHQKYDNDELFTTYFNGQITGVLKDLQRLDINNALERLRHCQDSLFPHIIVLMNEETGTNLVKDLVRVQHVTEMVEVAQVMLFNRDVYSKSLQSTSLQKQLISNTKSLMSKWIGRMEGGTTSLLLAESILSIRLALIEQLYCTKAISLGHVLMFMDQIHEVVRSKSGALAVSPLVYKLKSLIFHELEPQYSPSSPPRNAAIYYKSAWALQECKLIWKKGLNDVAISNIDALVIRPLGLFTASADNLIEYSNLVSEAYCLAGEWMSSRRAATSTDILQTYFSPAAAHASTVTQQIKAHSTLGHFLTRLYQSTKARITSSEWKLGKTISQERKVEFDRCMELKADADKKRAASGTLDYSEEYKALAKHLQTLRNETDMDNKERSSVETSVDKYLLDALEEYRKVLTISTNSDQDVVFKVINLWMTNSSKTLVNGSMDMLIKQVPTFKFVPLTYQILSRLGSDSPAAPPIDTKALKKGSKAAVTALDPSVNFELVLSEFILRLCKDHPHHTLPQLFALANEGQLGKYTGAEAFKSNMSQRRLQAAEALIKRLRLIQSDIVEPLKLILDAYITLASTSTTDLQKSHRIRDISFKELQGKGKLFDTCLDAVGPKQRSAVITLPHLLRADCDYTKVVRNMKIKDVFSITESGLSRPKIIKIQGSDGVWYRQLVKGGDDMRQDAVMEQVFEHVNQTLNCVEETRKRKLRIRTYKIVPTTPQSGVIQWVENTVAFGSILTDSDKGLHARYYPSDWSHSQCREYLQNASKSSNRIESFRTILNMFHPAFRYFFLENFSEVSHWMTCRLAYTRSVAVTSIVGYILGIGDRHAHNVLVDTTTAEVVHIDFGIAYEQGKGLGTPETVPFRLTRDIIDGFGITGCEGTYRQSCKEVLRVLRDNSSQLLTILEVVIHDPLYKWSLSPVQARKRQKSQDVLDDDIVARNAAEMNHASESHSFGRDAAERTLLRIKNKLNGFEDPTGEPLGVEGQVELCINEARSYENLSRMFHGWAPWL